MKTLHKEDPITQINLGLPEGVCKTRLVELLGLAKTKLKIKKSEFAYLKQIIELTMPQDYEQGAICTYFGAVTRIAGKLEKDPRTINDYERALNGKWIALTVSKRGKRGGKREEGAGGKIKYAKGVSLVPLINRFAEIQKAAEEVVAHRERMDAQRGNLLFYRSELIENGFEREAKEIYHRGRPSEIKDAAVLTEILNKYQALYEEKIVQPNLRKTDGLSEDFACPNTKRIINLKLCTKKSHSHKFEPDVLQKIGSAEFQESFDRYSRTNSPDAAFELAAFEACERMGISLWDFHDIKRMNGPAMAALCTLIIDCNSQPETHLKYKVDDARKCLGGMKRKLGGKGFNLSGMLLQAQKAARYRNVA